MFPEPCRPRRFAWLPDCKVWHSLLLKVMWHTLTYLSWHSGKSRRAQRTAGSQGNVSVTDSYLEVDTFIAGVLTC